VTDTARASTRRSCRSERMSNNGRPTARIVRASFLATPASGAHVRQLWSFFWPALERHSRDGPLKPTGESSPSSLLPL
jgi:hypothetical protein